MNAFSIFNDVIGPVMRGPSSSHTAGAYHIGSLALSLLGGDFEQARFVFDPEGSYGKVYSQQGADLAFAAGLLGWPITDGRFHQSIEAAGSAGKQIEFSVEHIPDADHPNTVEIDLLSANGRRLRLSAKSTGGGAIEITRLNDWPVQITGRFHEIALELESGSAGEARKLLAADGELSGEASEITHDGKVFLSGKRLSPLPSEARTRLEALPGMLEMWASEPIFFVERGKQLWSSAGEMVAIAGNRGATLGRLALEYESVLLGLGEDEILKEMGHRFDVMKSSIERGLEEDPPGPQLLAPCAGLIYESEQRGNLATGGIHTRAAARALAVMHVNAGMGVVCAAPTAGSAGVLPAVVHTMAEEKALDPDAVSFSMLAAGAIGVIFAQRATFAAEIAGCQMEIGAAGAMAAAAVVDAAAGSAEQAADAAAISLQNSMGSVCDLVQGMVEIPCHTRNAAAASAAFICADLILGGYSNPIGLDETVDAAYEVGKSLPVELRCTALGGLAATPSALSLRRRPI